MGGRPVGIRPKRGVDGGGLKRGLGVVILWLWWCKRVIRILSSYMETV